MAECAACKIDRCELAARGDLAAARACADEALAQFLDRIETLYGAGVVDAVFCKARYLDGSLASRRPEAAAHCERCIARMSDVIDRGGFRHDHYNRGTCFAYLDRDAKAEADFTADSRRASITPSTTGCRRAEEH